MNGVLRPQQEYRVGEGRTVVRFMRTDELFAEGDLRGVLYIFDSNTRRLFSRSFPHEVVIPAGEDQKNFGSVEAILARALEAELGRDATFVACGGGVVCDVAAFAASIYLRGVRIVLVPTTLLAMVDAAFGGKTGIDYRGYKNMVGTFHPAAELRLAVGLLGSLSSREYRSGLAEVIKHSLLERSGLRALLLSRREAVLERDEELLAEIVADALEVKARVVERDFREAGERAHLNLGHTFGHALEAVTGFTRFTHGEAVAWGIDKAMRMGVRLGVTDRAYAGEVTGLLLSYGFPLANLPELAEAVVAAMRQDKKKRSGRLRFVLQRGWGETYVTEVDDAVALEVLKG